MLMVTSQALANRPYSYPVSVCSQRSVRPCRSGALWSRQRPSRPRAAPLAAVEACKPSFDDMTEASAALTPSAPPSPVGLGSGVRGAISVQLALRGKLERVLRYLG